MYQVYGIEMSMVPFNKLRVHYQFLSITSLFFPTSSLRWTVMRAAIIWVIVYTTIIAVSVAPLHVISALLSHLASAVGYPNQQHAPHRLLSICMTNTAPTRLNFMTWIFS